MFQFKAPPVTSTVAAPQVTVPQTAGHAGSISLLSALGAIKDVAASWRDHQDAVAQADAMAGVLEKNGMQAEADAYRTAAKTFKVNFFSDPASAQTARSKMLSDSISLLGQGAKRKYQQQLLELRGRELDNKSEIAQEKLNQAEDKMRALQESKASDREIEQQRVEIEWLKAQVAAKNAKTNSQNADTNRFRAENQAGHWENQDNLKRQMFEAKYASEIEAKEVAKRVMESSGLTPVEVRDSNGKITLIYRDKNGSFSKEKNVFSEDASGNWKITRSNLSDEELNRLLEKRGQAPVIDSQGRVIPSQSTEAPPTRVSTNLLD